MRDELELLKMNFRTVTRLLADLKTDNCEVCLDSTLAKLKSYIHDNFGKCPISVKIMGDYHTTNLQMSFNIKEWSVNTKAKPSMMENCQLRR